MNTQPFFMGLQFQRDLVVPQPLIDVKDKFHHFSDFKGSFFEEMSGNVVEFLFVQKGNQRRLRIFDHFIQHAADVLVVPRIRVRGISAFLAGEHFFRQITLKGAAQQAFFRLDRRFSSNRER